MNYLITAGPTREPIDAVRFLSNRSSGRFGLALAAAAAAAGHAVTLLLGPIEQPTLPEHDRIRIERFETTEQLQALLDAHFPRCDALIMAAAVADYRPVALATGKGGRGEAGQRLTLDLEPTPDLVAALAQRKQPGRRIVAFALEEAEHLTSRAEQKLRAKGVDAIVANPLEAMGSDKVNLHFVTAAGRTAPPAPPGAPGPPGAWPKPEAARWLIEQVERLFEPL